MNSSGRARRREAARTADGRCAMIADLYEVGGTPHSPDHVIVDGAIWECETNGWAMVLRRVKRTGTPRSTGARSDIETCYAAASPPARVPVTTAHKLARQLGAPAADQGLLAKRVIRMAGASLNGNLVAGALAVAKARGRCRVWVIGHERALIVAGDGWRIVVMPLLERQIDPKPRKTIDCGETAARRG